MLEWLRAPIVRSRLLTALDRVVWILLGAIFVGRGSPWLGWIVVVAASVDLVLIFLPQADP